MAAFVAAPAKKGIAAYATALSQKTRLIRA